MRGGEGWDIKLWAIIKRIHTSAKGQAYDEGEFIEVREVNDYPNYSGANNSKDNRQRPHHTTIGLCDR